MKFRNVLPAIVANISAALSELLLIASAAWLIATAALHPPLSKLAVGITLVRTAGISRAVLRYVDRFISHKIIFKFLDDLRGKFYARAAQIFPLKSGRSHEGELLHSLTVSADLLKDFLPRVVLPLSTAAIVTILLTYFLREPLLPIIFIANVALAALIQIKTADDSDYRQKIIDFHDGQDELIIFGTKYPVNALNHVAKDFGEKNFQLTARQINIDTTFKVLNVAGFFFILLKLAAVVDTIALTVWSLIFIATLEVFATIPNSIRSLKKILAINMPTVKNLPPAQILSTNHAVEVKNLSFGYADEKIFEDFNLTIERGERIAIVGESGAGKTTLLYLLTNLFAPDGGNISFGGNVAAATFNNYIFSNSIRYNFQILHENISDEQILAALKICGLADFDIDVPIGEDGANLSGGERNRLQIALAIAKNPDILILDEPTAGLDKICAESLIKNLIASQKNRTLIIITHDSNYFSDLGRIELAKTKN